MQFSPYKMNNRNYPNVNVAFQGPTNIPLHPNKLSRYQSLHEHEQQVNFSCPNLYYMPTNDKVSSMVTNDLKNSIHQGQQNFPSSSNFIGVMKPQTPNQVLHVKNGNRYPLVNSYDLQYSNKQPNLQQKNVLNTANSLIFQNKQNDSNKPLSNYLQSINPPLKEKRMPRGSEPLMQNQAQQIYNIDKSYESFFKRYANPNKQSQSLFQSAQIELNRSYDTQKNQQMQKKVQKQKKNLMKRSSIQTYNHQSPGETRINQLIVSQKSSKQEKGKQFTVQDFQKIKQLGSGKYGHVFLVREKQTNYICALKQIDKKLLRDEQITEQFIRQIKIQTFLHHPNIVRLLGFFEDTLSIYIILEAAMGGQLYHHIKKSECLPQNKVAYYMRQVCEAVKEIHSLRIIHRDIKPENIVLHQNVIKLCDFGWSVRQETSLRTTFCGTPLYVCPEILKGNDYDSKIDIWSLGVMMYEMLVGQNPFNITKQEELIKIIRDEVLIPPYVKISKQAESLLHMCLKKDPTKRADIRQITDHQFFKKYPDKQAQKNKLTGF